MQPVKLEIFLDDKTRSGMQSAERNITGLESQMQEVINILKKELTGLQNAFRSALSQGISSPSDLADIQALKGKIGELEEELKRLKKQAEIPVKPNIDLSRYITDEVKAMTDAGERVKAIIINIRKDIDALRQKSMESAATGVVNPADTTKIKELEAQVRSLTETLVKYEVAKTDSNSTPIMKNDPAPRLNNVKMSMQQIARELPALSMGPQMFFLAISNNIPMFTDAIAAARKEYELMTAAGKKATPVWKQLLTSLFSWQTMMAAAITLTVVYGKEIGEWVKGLFNAKDATTELLSAEQEMALARSKASESIKKERSELDILYLKMKNTSLSTKERTVAVNEWIKKYPQYASILDGENINLSKLESAYRTLSKEIYANAVARQYIDKVADLSVKKEREEIKRLNQKATLLKTQKVYEDAINTYNKYTGQSKNAAAINVGRAEVELQKQQKIYDSIVKNVQNYDKSITDISNHIASKELFSQPKEGTRDYWQQQKSRAEGVLKEIRSDIKKTLDDAEKKSTDLFSLGIDKSIVETYKQATSQIKEARKNLKIYNSGDEIGKGISDKRDYQTELSEARLRAQQKLESARISVMESGRNKRKAIARQEYKETLSEIDKEEKDILSKLEKSKQSGNKVNPDEVRKVKDNATTQRVLAMAQYMQTTFEIEKEWRDKNRQSWIDYNKEYGNYQEKRLAISQDYALKIGRAETEGEKASLKRERDDKLKEHDFDNFKSSINLADVFGNLDEQSTDALYILRDKLKEYINGAARELRPSDLKDLQNTLTRIDFKLSDRKPFRELKQSLGDYQEAQDAVQKSQSDLNALLKGGEVITGIYRDETGKLVKTLLTQEQAEKKLSDAQNNRQQKQASLAQSMSSVGNELASYGRAAETIISTLEGFGMEMDANVKGIVEGFNTMSEGISEFGQSLMTGNIAGMINGAVNAIGGTLKTLGSLFGADWGGERSRKRYEDAKQKYEDYMDVLDQVISKQKELVASMESGDFANANNSYERARELLKKQQDYAREMGKAYLNSGASKGFLGIGSSASEGTRQREDISASAWEQARKALGRDYDKISGGRMTGLFDLSYEQLVKLRDEASGFWSELHQDTQEYLNQIIESEEAWREVQESRKEALTKTDFDSFYNEFITMLSDMDATSEDFADNFEKYLQNAIFSSLVATKYRDKIQQLYDSWSDMAESDSVLSGAEADKLREEYRKIIDDMMKERNQMMNDFNWSPSDESSSQSGRSGAFTAMTQEQGTKLEGLFTSLQDHASGIHQLVEDLKRGRDADHELFMRIADNTEYCKLLEDIYDLMTRQERDGYKMK